MAKKKELDNMAMLALQQAQNGAIIDDLSFKMREVIEAVRRTGKKGVVTLKLEITKLESAKERSDQVRLDGEVTYKKPGTKAGSALFYINDQNGLQRQDPEGPGLFGEDSYDDNGQWTPAAQG